MRQLWEVWQAVLVLVNLVTLSNITFRKQYNSETNFKAVRNVHPLGRKLRTPKIQKCFFYAGYPVVL